MFAPFPEEEASLWCRKIIDSIENKEIKCKRKNLSKERKNHGIMLGVLVARDSLGGKHVLVSLSGFDAELFIPKKSSLSFVEVVPPLVAEKKINKALKKNDLRIHRLTKKINSLKKKRKESRIPLLREMECIEKRKLLTTESLLKIHNLYGFTCADGKLKSLKEVCKEYNNSKLPPTGTGDCAEPRLLDYAFRHSFVPLSMCEVYYGKENSVRKNLRNYTPCDERCGIVLPSMLGLKIVYRDKNLIVVNKQSGVLSVPGRGIEKSDCIVNRVKRLFPECIEQPAVHRLDMETSGLLVLAFDKETHRALNKQFEEGTVKKEYVALLDGVTTKKNIPFHGISELYFRLDVEHRPHQIWDRENGKKAVTEWQVLGFQKYTSPNGIKRDVTRILFIPHTGRTHQLRLASSDAHGFGIPIIGDTLYGKCEAGERLMLHARYLEFTHPATGERMKFECREEF